ncbi:cytoplasmic iron level regulating protein YaaA (DUF328/UPF0246 family) [Nakamurella sp. UYEF19]|uniref:YaaA family protein n=1 Tax=Nakamurella sp. UYEF19 TaxID=1756392 RepID=UPI003390D152
MTDHASVAGVYVLLPPSETKSKGGTAPALDLDGLSFPSLTPIRSRLITETVRLASDVNAARAALRISAAKDGEIRGNAALLTGPTLPALSRYTGVLYTALQTPRISKAEASRADHRLLITSALFGLIAGGDRIPAYRISAGSRLPGMPTMTMLWRDAMSAVLAGLEGPVLDLRSGAYASFAPAPQAITVRVVTMTRSGERKPVSHDNKAIKGVLARLVGTTRATIDDLSGLLRVTYRAGLVVKRTGPSSIDLDATNQLRMGTAQGHR